MIAAFSTSLLAFTGSAPVRSSKVAMSSVPPQIKSDAGVSAPFGYFDPAGLMSNGEQQADYARYKEVEIKHGRLAMLAATGFVVGEQFHPLFGGNIDAPSAFAFQQTPLQTFWPLVVAAIGLVEIATSVPTFKDPNDALWKMKAGRVPGDLGLFGGAAKAKSDPAGFKGMQTREINNGRLAMLAVAGMTAQELVTGQKLF
uniref:Uncharacterized protein n=1 Tax=Diacronema lutheri TaxID=2081491 RepID=A0A7R9UJ33_DIALT|mmetsp:Transcript_12952/g.40695  ORF Transcript_12952/g.40695 Transcript_12952/m.40695 type:complete len:200 (+) Transcript_12952:63-662(+)